MAFEDSILLECDTALLSGWFPSFHFFPSFLRVKWTKKSPSWCIIYDVYLGVTPKYISIKIMYIIT